MRGLLLGFVAALTGLSAELPVGFYVLAQSQPESPEWTVGFLDVRTEHDEIVVRESDFGPATRPCPGNSIVARARVSRSRKLSMKQLVGNADLCGISDDVIERWFPENVRSFGIQNPTHWTIVAHCPEAGTRVLYLPQLNRDVEENRNWFAGAEIASLPYLGGLVSSRAFRDVEWTYGTTEEEEQIAQAAAEPLMEELRAGTFDPPGRPWNWTELLQDYRGPVRGAELPKTLLGP